jgi:hypothetical protein
VRTAIAGKNFISFGLRGLTFHRQLICFEQLKRASQANAEWCRVISDTRRPWPPSFPWLVFSDSLAVSDLFPALEVGATNARLSTLCPPMDELRLKSIPPRMLHPANLFSTSVQIRAASFVLESERPGLFEFFAAVPAGKRFLSLTFHPTR